MTPNMTVILVCVLVAIGLFGFLFWLILNNRQTTLQQFQDMTRQIIEAQKQNQSTEFLQREINNLRDQLGKTLTESARMMSDSQKSVGERLDRAAEVVGNVQKALGALDGATKQVFQVGKDIAQLQEILRAPKMRGAFGEFFLGDLLAQILPPKHYALQHKFKSGEIVDAVVRLGLLVPVDAKFPLENFKRLLQQQDPQERTQNRRRFIMDVKKHIDAIASKYIVPDEGTFGFALMYIPAENVYYETIIKDDSSAEDTEISIMAYAFSKRVIPVSPNSFYSYLHTISLGLRGLQIGENAKRILENLDRLQGDFARFKEDFSLVGKHLNNSRTKFEDAERRLARFEDKLSYSGEKALDSAPAEPTALPLN